MPTVDRFDGILDVSLDDTVTNSRVAGEIRPLTLTWRHSIEHEGIQRMAFD